MRRAGSAIAADPEARQEVFPDKNVWLAVLFSMFMHGSILHVLGNMLFLWIFGNNVEDRFGPSGSCASTWSLGVAATRTACRVQHRLDGRRSIGASGAIAGVMGAYIVWWPHARVLSLVPILFFFGFIELPAAAVLGIWFVMQFFTNPNEGHRVARARRRLRGGRRRSRTRCARCCRRARSVRRGPPPVWGRRYRAAMTTTGIRGFGGGYRGRT